MPGRGRAAVADRRADVSVWGGLSPWGHARQRMVRGVGVLRPRRARCGRCLVTHVLLAVSCLLRRADGVDVIGAALARRAAGEGHRPIAAGLGRPATTVRGWQRTFARNAGPVHAVLVALLVQVDPLTGPPPVRGGGFADAVEVIGSLGSAARRRLGVVGAVSAWQAAAGATDGLMLSPARSWEPINTN